MSAHEDDDIGVRLNELDPGARDLVYAIMEQSAKDIAWTEQRIAEIDEAQRLQAIVDRGDRIKSRLNEIFRTLYGEALGLRYEEREVDGMTLKRLTICWWDDEFEDLIDA